MENLAAPHQVILHCLFEIKRGNSLRAALILLEESSNNPDIQILCRYLLQGRELELPVEWQSNELRRNLGQCLLLGLSGHRISEYLQWFEKHVREESELELLECLEQLPIRSLLPVLLFQFPAVLILIFAPLLRIWGS